MAYTPNQYLNSVTGNTTFIVPASMYIKRILIENTTANTVTGGLKIGTTNGGVDVATAITVLGNSLQSIPDSALSKSLFSRSIDTTLYIQAVTLWNSANLNISIELGKF